MSTLSYSKLNSYQSSRLSAANSMESFAIRKSNAMLSAFPATFSSNNLSGLSQLNLDVLKPLRVDRIDRSSGSIKWISSSSGDSDHMKIIPDDIHMAKNRDDVSNINGVRMYGKNVIMTSNERRKTNQNNLEDKLLSIKIKEIDRLSTNTQSQIKRERYKLLDQFIESKAQNLNFSKKKFSLPDDDRDMDLKAVLQKIEEHHTKLKTQSAHPVLKSFEKTPTQMSLDKTSFKNEKLNSSSKLPPPPPPPQPKIDLQKSSNELSNQFRMIKANTSLGIVMSQVSDDDFFSQPYLYMNAKQTFSRPNENFMSNVTARFIEQKSKYYPSYLKQTKKAKFSIPSTEIDQALAKASVLGQKRMCSKHKQHRLAQIKADLYKSTKELLREDAANVHNDLINTAEQALTADQNKKEETIKVVKRSETSMTSNTNITEPIEANTNQVEVELEQEIEEEEIEQSSGFLYSL